MAGRLSAVRTCTDIVLLRVQRDDLVSILDIILRVLLRQRLVFLEGRKTELPLLLTGLPVSLCLDRVKSQLLSVRIIPSGSLPVTRTFRPPTDTASTKAIETTCEEQE